MTTEPQAAAAPSRAQPLHPKYFTLDTAGQVVSTWVASPPAGVTIEDIQRPDYWVHVAPKLRPLALIRVFPEDGTWEAELRVHDAGGQWAKVGLIRHQPWDMRSASEVDGLFVIEWGGPMHKWRIRRKSDGSVVEKELPTKEAAYARLPDLLRKAA